MNNTDISAGLTEEMQAALIRGIRSQQANRLRIERKLYRAGLSSLDKSKSYRFIQHKRTNLASVDMSDLDSLLSLQREIDLGAKLLQSHEYGVNVEFEAEQEDADQYSYCSQSEDIKATVFKYGFYFPQLKQVKRDIESLINYIIREAKFKLVYQPNGKDTCRFLDLINKYL